MTSEFGTSAFCIAGTTLRGSSIIGFGEAHTRAHLYRAILEGLAYALREGRERLEKRSGVKMKELRVSGGGSLPCNWRYQAQREG